MRAIDVLLKQYDSINSNYHSVADDLTEDEWSAIIMPDTNPLGFTLLHISRAQDWAIQTMARGVPEVVRSEPWNSSPAMLVPGFGIGQTLEQAQQVAAALRKDELLSYADAVHASLRGWLSSVDDDILDAPVDWDERLAPFAEYREQSFLDEVIDMKGLPAWRFILGPANGHVRLHLGEAMILKQIVRTPVASGS